MTARQNITLSLSIVVYNTPPTELRHCLDSLLVSIRQARQISGLGHSDLYLINNGEQPLPEMRPLEADLAGMDCSLRRLQGHGNVGYGRGHNLSISPTNANYHLLMNPDVVLDQNSLAEGISYLEANPAVVILAPYAAGPDDRKQYLCKRYPSVTNFLLRGFFPQAVKQKFSRQLAWYEMHDLAEDRATHGIPIVSGCFMLCRADVLKAVGGFDERYFMYFEDFDLSLRMAGKGELAYLPAMKIKHFGGNSSRKGLRHILMFVRSGIRFFNTWGWRFIQ